MAGVAVVMVDEEDLALLVAVALGTVERRRKRRQTMMTVGDEVGTVDSRRMLPLDLVEAIARKYAR